MVIGDRGLKNGEVEYQARRDAESQAVALDAVAAKVQAALGK